MNPEDIHPIIQQWIDSDEFIDSLVAVTMEFQLPDSSPVLDTIYSLIFKEVKPEEFKEKLLASLPEDKRIDAVLSKTVNLCLLPVKGHLSESGIDISVICPLDESSVKPYVPVPEEEEVADEIAQEPSPAPALSNAPASIEQTAESAQPLEPVVTEETPAPTPAPETVSPAEEDLNTLSVQLPPQVISETPPVLPSNDNQSPAPLITPQFDSPVGTSAPFIIHQEKAVPQTSASKKGNPLRPVFYSEEPASQENPSFANIQFGKASEPKEVDPTNVVNLKDLPL
jgi:hypothetical protein